MKQILIFIIAIRCVENGFFEGGKRFQVIASLFFGLRFCVHILQDIMETYFVAKEGWKNKVIINVF